MLNKLGLSFYFFRNLSIYQPSQEWEEMEQLVYEEYNPKEDKDLANILANQSVTVGVSLFLSDRMWSIIGPGSLNAAPVTRVRRVSPTGA